MTYATSLALNRRAGQLTRNQNSAVFRRSGRAIGPVSNAIILIVLACLLGLLYLTQVTKTNAYGYELSNAEEKQAQLAEEHNELEITSARLQSLDRVKNSEVAKKLTPATPKDTVR